VGGFYLFGEPETGNCWEGGEGGEGGRRERLLCPYLLSWGGVENPLKVNCALLMMLPKQKQKPPRGAATESQFPTNLLVV